MLYQIIIALLVGYLFGSIQPAYFLSKLVAKTDIREHGSGNAGASNITAIMGWKYGFIVAFIDVLKAMLAVLLIKWIYPHSPDLAYLAGIMAIIGHLFPFYMNFRGGKGVAALVGMMLGINWKLGILFMFLVALPALLADYIVAGSLKAFIIHLPKGYPPLGDDGRYPRLRSLIQRLGNKRNGVPQTDRRRTAYRIEFG